jgi:DNA segregation ATPase FtsK/SpoIIIE-like protein
MERIRAKRKLEQKREQELFRQGGFEDYQPRPSRSSYQREQQDEYEDDFGMNEFILVDDLEEFMQEGESESEEERSAALLEAKRSITTPEVKSKRLRIIEDSDSD